LILRDFCYFVAWFCLIHWCCIACLAVIISCYRIAWFAVVLYSLSLSWLSWCILWYRASYCWLPYRSLYYLVSYPWLACCIVVLTVLILILDFCLFSSFLFCFIWGIGLGENLVRTGLDFALFLLFYGSGVALFGCLGIVVSCYCIVPRTETPRQYVFIRDNEKAN
jgi:hypothetical protein